MAFRDPAPIKLTEVKKEVVRLDDDKQNKNSTNLTTTAKTIEGAINELKTKSDTLASNSALKSTQIIAGNGLQGGGTLNQNRTLSIKGANDSITTSSSGLAVNTYNGVDSTSTTRPASANALKTTYDKLVKVESTANSKLSKTGDTMSGNISFSNQGTTFVGLKGSVGDDDGWRIAGGSTAGNVGELEIATGFSGNQPIYVRQYNGANYSTIARTLTLLDSSGNTKFPGTLTASKISGALTGNASTATSLQTARTINGTSFNGTANITTANWGTARTLTVGNTGKSVNGSANVSWSLSEIGALPLTGGTLTGNVAISNASPSFTVKNTGGNDVSLVFDRSSNANWRVRNSLGKLLFECDYFTKKTDYYQAMTLDYNSGDMTVKGRVTAPTFSGSLSGNASTATKLQTARTINGVSFDGSANITVTAAANGGTSASCSGNSATATKLQTARTINGTSFNGSANITTSNWGTARGITIGNTKKSVNGSVDVSWSLNEIGAFGKQGEVNSSTNWNNLRTPGVYKVHMHAWGDVSLGAPNNAFASLYYYGILHVYQSNVSHEERTTQVYYPHRSDNSNPIVTRMYNASGWNNWSKLGRGLTHTDVGAAASSHTHNYAGSSSAGGSATTALACTGNSATATKLATARTINGTSFDGSANITTANWGTARTLTIGNTGKSVNGSANISWSLSEIGAAASSHTHNYAGSSSAGGSATTALACTGNSATATKLATARQINGVNFDGTANITIKDSTKLATTGGTISGNLTVTGAIVANGNVTAYSDRRLKTDIVKITNALDKVNQINGYTFTMLGIGQRQAGVIAQEIEKVLPEVVVQNENGYLTVMYGNIVSLLIEAVKELSNEVEKLKGGRI